MPSRLRTVRRGGVLLAYPSISHPDTKLILYHTLRAKSVNEGGLTEQDVYSVCREVLGLLPSKRWCLRLLAEYQKWSSLVRQYDTMSEWSLYEKKPKVDNGNLFKEQS